MARRLLTSEDDWQLRETAFAFLRAKLLSTGGVVRFDDVFGFEFRGQRIALMDRQRGIRKPAAMEAALAFRTVHAERPDQRPYHDEPGADGLLRYKWRGTDPSHSENIALRRACERQVPLIWFQGIASGIYLPVFPVWLAAEEPDSHQFVVALDKQQLDHWRAGTPPSLLRVYAETTAKRRLHQPVFRARVLAEYGEKCTICRFRHRSLLDAAHIKPDSEGGPAVVTNGLSLCKIHHGAYDASLISIDPDHRVVVRPDVLEETDGPTLEHSIKAMHGKKIELPSRRLARPDPDFLSERHRTFLSSF